jgi:hypothetical protein
LQPNTRTSSFTITGFKIAAVQIPIGFCIHNKDP